VVRREAVNDENVKFMLTEAPNILMPVIEGVARSMKNNEKLIHQESFINFTYTCAREYASRSVMDMFEEFKSLDRTISYECIFHSYPASYCMLLAISEAVKDKGMMEQAKFVGQTGEQARK